MADKESIKTSVSATSRRSRLQGKTDNASVASSKIGEYINPTDDIEILSEVEIIDKEAEIKMKAKDVTRNLSQLINPDKEPLPTWEIHHDFQPPSALDELLKDFDLSSFNLTTAETSALSVHEQEEKFSTLTEQLSRVMPQLSLWQRAAIFGSSESTVSELDRTALITEMVQLKKSLKAAKLRNALLQALMANYYRNNNMEVAIVQPEKPRDTPATLDRYSKRLLRCYQSKMEYQKYREEIEVVRGRKVTLRNKKRAVVDDEMSKLTAREKSTGTGLLSAKTGNVLPDKVVEKLIKKQYQSMQTLTEWRVKFIKIRDRVNIIDAKVKTIENIGDGLRLSDYEDMMLEANNSMEKIEEKEEELLHLRRKCNEATQMLAHMREKQYAVDGNTAIGKKTMETLQEKVAAIRVRITKHRRRKVWARNSIEKVKDRHALLFKKSLLCDYVTCVDKEATKRAELQVLKKTFEEERERLRKLRCTLKPSRKECNDTCKITYNSSLE